MNKVHFYSLRTNSKGHASIICTSSKLEQSSGTILGIENVSTRKSTPVKWGVAVLRENGEFCTMNSPIMKKIGALKPGAEIPGLKFGEEVPPIPGKESTNKFYWVEVA